MQIATVEFKDVQSNNFTIRHTPSKGVEHIDTITKPTGLWFHYDTAKYTREEAERLLVLSYVEMHTTEILEHTTKIQAITKQHGSGAIPVGN